MTKNIRPNGKEQTGAEITEQEGRIRAAKENFDRARPVGPDGYYTVPHALNRVPIVTHPDDGRE